MQPKSKRSVICWPKMIHTALIFIEIIIQQQQFWTATQDFSNTQLKLSIFSLFSTSQSVTLLYRLSKQFACSFSCLESNKLNNECGIRRRNEYILRKLMFNRVKRLPVNEAGCVQLVAIIYWKFRYNLFIQIHIQFYFNLDIPIWFGLMMEGRKKFHVK